MSTEYQKRYKNLFSQDITACVEGKAFRPSIFFLAPMKLCEKVIASE